MCTAATSEGDAKRKINYSLPAVTAPLALSQYSPLTVGEWSLSRKFASLERPLPLTAAVITRPELPIVEVENAGSVPSKSITAAFARLARPARTRAARLVNFMMNVFFGLD